MRYIETDNPDDFISDLKCAEDANSIRLSFRWPSSAAQVYVFKTEAEHSFDFESASPSGARLFTHQEYKKLAGFTDGKAPGVYTYHIFPFIREGGEDILLKQSDGKNFITCLAGQMVVQFSVKEKNALFGGGKTHTVTLSCEQPVEADVLCYVIKENGYPANARDGTVYFFGEALRPGQVLSRQIKTGKNEFIRIFINDPEKEKLYDLRLKNGTVR